MKTISCDTARERLSSYHDNELPLEEQIAVEGHLQSCPACAEEAEGLRSIGELVRAAGQRPPLNRDPWVLPSVVLTRLKAECAARWDQRFRRLFDDSHAAWALAGATTAALFCAVILQSILSLAAERPDSMYAVVKTLATAVRVAPPINEPISPPRADPDAIMAAAAINQGRKDNAAYALSAIVAIDGTISNVEMLMADDSWNSRKRPNEKEVLAVLDAASTARFEPARYAGSPISVSMIWVLAHTTVRAKAKASAAPANAGPSSPAVPEPAPPQTLRKNLLPGYEPVVAGWAGA